MCTENTSFKLPAVAASVLEKLLPQRDRQYILGDLAEFYNEFRSEKGPLIAWFWCWLQVFKSLPGIIHNQVYWKIVMFNNYVKTAVRNILKFRLNNFLNITGLSLGMAAALLILFHVRDELSYDRHFSKAERIYRITNEVSVENNFKHWAVVSWQHADELQKFFPEIEYVTRLRVQNSLLFTYFPATGNPVSFEEKNGFFADESVIDLLDLNFHYGSEESALETVNSVIVSKSMAERYFGNVDPVGEIFDTETDTVRLTVTGVFDDIPYNTHFKSDYFVSMPTFEKLLIDLNLQQLMSLRTWSGIHTYVLLNSNSNRVDLEARMPGFQEEYYSYLGSPEDVLTMNRLHLQPLTSIHLNSNLENEIGQNGNIVYIYIFITIAMLVLIIASVNFVNIHTAQALKRLKEIGVRRLLGAQKMQIAGQYFGETFLMTTFSAAAALVIFYIMLPLYNSFSGKMLDISVLFNVPNLLLLAGTIVLTTLLSGTYPALFAAGFQPVYLLKGMKNPSSATVKLRKTLVILQFALSIFMIFSTITIYYQMELFRSKDLGFDKDNIIAVRLHSKLREEVLNNIDALRNELLSHAAVIDVTETSNLPGDRMSVEPFFSEAIQLEEEQPEMRFIRGGMGFVNTLGLELVAGRDFTTWTSESSAYLLNENAVKALQLENPVGIKGANFFRIEGEVIGVVKDFNYATLHENIEPLIIEYSADPGFKINTITYLLVKVKGENIGEVVDFLKEKTAAITAGMPMFYTLLDENLRRLYVSEDRMSSIFRLSSMLAILISCLGLFGLAAYSSEVRTKELGVRKALGASPANLFFVLSGDFLKWVLAAHLAALPVAWYVMEQWMQNFAYQNGISIYYFAITVLLVLTVSLATVSVQSLQAIRRSPVNSLRYE